MLFKYLGLIGIHKVRFGNLENFQKLFMKNMICIRILTPAKIINLSKVRTKSRRKNVHYLNT